MLEAQLRATPNAKTLRRFTCGRMDRIQVFATNRHNSFVVAVKPTAPIVHAASADAAGLFGRRDDEPLFPQRSPRRGIQRHHEAIGSLRIEHIVNHDRRRLQIRTDELLGKRLLQTLAVAGPSPHDSQRGHVAHVNLIQGRIARVRFVSAEVSPLAEGALPLELKAAKLELFEHFARVGKAVGSRPRLLLLDLLAQGEKTVERLARQTGLTIGNTSAHLKGLRQVSLVSPRKDGAHVYYRLASQQVHEFVRSLQTLARGQLAEAREIIDDYFHDPDVLEPVHSADLLDGLRDGAVTVLDVRPPDEYAAAHIPGAISMPFGEIEQRLDELPSDGEIVAYCRGPYCIYAVRAVETLRRLGFRARRLEDGIPDWTLRGLPVAVSASQNLND